jgi:hypothetical protein
MKAHDFAIDCDIDAHTRSNPPCSECGEELAFVECKYGECAECKAKREEDKTFTASNEGSESDDPRVGKTTRNCFR